MRVEPRQPNIRTEQTYVFHFWALCTGNIMHTYLSAAWVDFFFIALAFLDFASTQCSVVHEYKRKRIYKNSYMRSINTTSVLFISILATITNSRNTNVRKVKFELENHRYCIIYGITKANPCGYGRLRILEVMVPIKIILKKQILRALSNTGLGCTSAERILYPLLLSLQIVSA
jgi:hypothetical protein